MKRLQNLRNQAMRRKLEAGECLCVRDIGEPINDGTVFKLRGYIDNMDYCDTVNEEWIWSIGKRFNDGEIYAATDNRFYDNKEYLCLWLR